MSKRNLARLLACEAQITERDAYQTLTALLAVTRRELVAGREVPLTGIGILSPVRRAPRAAMNPYAGTKVTIPERTMVRLRMSRTLLRDINAGASDGPL
jgi:nucleoid DNA-binding protein